MSAPVDSSRHITTMDPRAKLGDVLDRVRLRFDTFVIERKGEEVAAGVRSGAQVLGPAAFLAAWRVHAGR